jgi:hypothetical protein
MALCDEHLHGSLVQRLRVDLFGREAVCPVCREQETATRASATR